MQLPKLTTKQQTILKLLYTFRFLNRTQVQALLSHKDKKTINVWLKDLTQKQYTERMYDADDFVGKTKPAVYYLALNGIRFLKTLDKYPPEELRKRYREAERQQDFIDRCLLLTDCCVAFKNRSTGDVQYSYVTQADYADPESGYHSLSELGPHLYVGKREPKTTTNYLIEAFDATLPRYRVRKRLKDYVDYVSGGDWERETDDDKPPIALLILPTKSELIYAKRRTRKLLEDEGIDEDDDIHIRFSTIEKVRQKGATEKIWEEVLAS